MTSLLNLVNSDKYLDNLFKHRNPFLLNTKCKHLLKSKENVCKIRNNKELKRKLKKYRLRPDGKEDQDVIEVSNFFVTSLTIRSPNSKKKYLNNIDDTDIIRPKNYLFKMGRKSSRPVEANSGNKSKEKLLKGEKIVEISSVQNKSQSQKQTNAFQLLMESRNKVIGSNSPGKEKCTVEVDISKEEEKRELKTKRQLLLQNMAEAKGALEKKELEELQEKFIKRKMEKRANKLKTNLLNNYKNINTNKLVKVEDVNHVENNKPPGGENTNVLKLNKLQSVNVFNKCEMDMIKSPNKIQTTTEDEEFLKKLSPSLKKKQNMLSYFKKLDKETDLESEKLLIKVKLKARNTKIMKKRSRANIHKESSKELIVCHDNNRSKTQEDIQKKSDNREQKENKKLPVKLNESTSVNKDRPKRSIKRPVKYVDDLSSSSSDDDCDTFTPKKKRKNSMPPKSNDLDKKGKELTSLAQKSVNVPRYKTFGSQNKPAKLAPIFATKILPSIADIEARQKFLQSGVPEQLKKRSIKQDTSYSVNTCFPITVHINQNNDTIEIVSQRPGNIPLMDISCDDYTLTYSNDMFKSFITKSKVEIPVNYVIPIQNLNVMLKNIKKLNPRFPVYRTYHLLRDKSKGETTELSYLELDDSVEVLTNFPDFCNENPEQLNWTSKYKPTSSKQIIGNFESIKELRKWLVQWTENEAKKKLNKDDSDFSDFYQSDTDSRESMKSSNNLLIITGPVGCGKTSGVYAVAAELGIKVLEVNTSSKRTGKIMLQDLHEATQSHKVNRGTNDAEFSQKLSGAENSQKSQDFILKTQKRGRPKKCKVQENIDNKNEILNGMQSSQDNSRTRMSLILIDDADIVFEQDDGFCSAIVQLVQCSKRPVILITSTLSCLHLQRFIQIGKIIKMNPLLPNMLGTWLDVLCLVNNGICWPGLGAKFLDMFKGDMRRTVNHLHFYTQTDNNHDDQIISSQEILISENEEQSNLSWADQETAESNDSLGSDWIQMWGLFTDEMFDLAKTKHHVSLFNVWWNIPKLLINQIASKSPTQATLPTNSSNSNDNLKKLEILANSIDALSIGDTFRVRGVAKDLTSSPWFTAEMDSVSEQNNTENYTRGCELSAEISSEYVRENVLLALNETSNNYTTMALDFPDLRKSREKDRIVSRHINLNECLNPSAVFDKRAIALDYWSICRSICRIERTKTDNNSKRNNRFCHYLQSMNANCKSRSFDNLADSLCVKGMD